jgi:hypothetical protein
VHSSVCGDQTGWRELWGRFSARRGKQPAGRRRSARTSALVPAPQPWFSGLNKPFWDAPTEFDPASKKSCP